MDRPHGRTRARQVLVDAPDIPGIEVLEELGRGAQAIVYRVDRNGCEYALKVLRPTGYDGHAATSFRREAGLVACITHPGVTEVYEVGAAAGRPYLVMELVDGRSLADLLDAGPLDIATVVGLGIDVASALAAAHRVGVVHRDVKPHNIVVSPDGRARLIDFGLATQPAGAIITGAVAGTVAYSAPEQTGMLKRPIDGRTDLYGLGVVLFECAAGRLPFTATEIGELLRQHATATPPDLLALRCDVPPALARIVARLLAKDPDDRYQTADGLLASLREIDGHPGDPPAGPRDGDAATGARRPLVGRKSEMSQLADAWRRIRYTHGGVGVVDGPPGIGKTRLVEEFCDRVASADNKPVLRITCTPDDLVPLAALRAGVDQFLRGIYDLPEQQRAGVQGRIRAAASHAAPVLASLSLTLASLLHTAPLPASEIEDRLGTAVAGFLSELARASEGAVVLVDGAQWLDPASRRLLGELVAELSTTPLFLILSGRAEPDTADPAAPPLASLPALLDAIGHPADLRLSLTPLDDDEIEALASIQLGGGALAGTLKRQLTSRVCGDPRTLLEYLRAMVEEGVVRPYWGNWVLDEAALDSVQLSADVSDLVVRRADRLTGAARRILTTAAAVPLPFWPGLIAVIGEVGYDEAVDAIQEGITHGILAPRPGGLHVFVHDLLPEALLAGLAEADRRELHQRVAGGLAGTGLGGPALHYAVAHQYVLGNPDAEPERAFAAWRRAGELALTEHIADVAHTFLERARELAERAGIEPDQHFLRAIGTANLLQGHYARAREHLEAAVRREPDRLGRGEILGLIAQTYQGEHASADAIASIERALAEVGRALPTNRIWLVVSTLAVFLAGVWVGGPTGRGFGKAQGDTLRRYRLLVELLRLGAKGAEAGLAKLHMTVFNLRSLFFANRIGSLPEYVRLRMELGALAHRIGWRRRGWLLFDEAEMLAEMHGDPRLSANVALAGALSDDLSRGLDADSGTAIREVLDDHGRWLDPNDYLNAVAKLTTIMVLRGYAREALGWHERARSRVADTAGGLGTPLATADVLAKAALGRNVQAAEGLGAIRSHPDTAGHPEQKVNLLIATMQAGLEQGAFGPEFDEALAEIRRSRLAPRRVWSQHRILWVYQAFALLARARTASDEDRRAQLAAAGNAVAQLRRAANTPLLRAFHHTARASHLQLSGRPDAALRELAAADRLLYRIDVPWLECETAVVRARVLLTTGSPTEALRQAKIAYLLANDAQWQQRVRAVRNEFIGAAGTDHAIVRSGVASDTTGGPYQRRLAALQEVSLAAATVLDPRELARVALDEIIRILGAERAFLFLADDDGSELRAHLGRNAAGEDLSEPTAYGSTLVGRVRDSREALVVTGSEQGAALGSESVVLHGLRSIMVAPLQIKGRLIGVVYLDNRIAKGVFTHGDVDILTAITHPIAASLETARAAQLELAVHAADQQRELADTMRTSMTEISATLDPDDVLIRLAGTLTRLLPTDLAYVVRPGPDGVTAAPVPLSPGSADGAGSDGAGSDGAVGEKLLGDRIDRVLLAALESGTPRAGTADDIPRQLSRLLSGARAWLAIPLNAREERIGVLVLASRSLAAYGDARAGIGAVLAEQGMTAYDNALLFRRVEQLATIDGLSGVSNRRHFFELASKEVSVAAGQQRSLATVMLDIDHFKKINDVHGHAVGDEVIRTVATRISDSLRKVDILGRYGGEEFAIVLPELDKETDVVAERLRVAIADVPIDTAAGPLPVTVSIGTARLLGPGDPLEAILDRADQALYQAKQSGRNRVCHA